MKYKYEYSSIINGGLLITGFLKYQILMASLVLFYYELRHFK